MIAGPILQEILATAMLLADPDKTRRHGEGLLAGQDRVVSSENGIDEVDQSEAVEVNNPVKPLITGLFDGIFEDDEQSESEPELDSEPVTTEDDNEEPSDPDFWF